MALGHSAVHHETGSGKAFEVLFGGLRPGFLKLAADAVRAHVEGDHELAFRGAIEEDDDVHVANLLLLILLLATAALAPGWPVTWTYEADGVDLLVLITKGSLELDQVELGALLLKRDRIHLEVLHWLAHSSIV